MRKTTHKKGSSKMNPTDVKRLYTTWGYAHYELSVNRLSSDKLAALEIEADNAEQILTENGYPMPLKPGTIVELPYGYNPCKIEQIVEYYDGHFRYTVKDRRMQKHVAKDTQITIVD